MRSVLFEMFQLGWIRRSIVSSQGPLPNLCFPLLVGHLMRRFGFRFGMKGLGLLVALACAVSAWLGSYYGEWHAQQRLASELRERSVSAIVEVITGDPDDIADIYSSEPDYWIAIPDGANFYSEPQPDLGFFDIPRHRIISVTCAGKHIDGGFLRKLKNCRWLQLLTLTGCTIEPGALREIGLPTTLRWLHIYNCEISPGDLIAISSLEELRWLKIANQGLRDRDVESFSGLENLTLLDLSGNSRLTGKTIKQLCTLPLLEELNVAGLALRDDSIADIQAIPSLKTINLTGTYISREGIERLRRNPKLQCVSQFELP